MAERSDHVGGALEAHQPPSEMQNVGDGVRHGGELPGHSVTQTTTALRRHHDLLRLWSTSYTRSRGHRVDRGWDSVTLLPPARAELPLREAESGPASGILGPSDLDVAAHVGLCRSMSSGTVASSSDCVPSSQSVFCPTPGAAAVDGSDDPGADGESMESFSNYSITRLPATCCPYCYCGRARTRVSYERVDSNRAQCLGRESSAPRFLDECGATRWPRVRAGQPTAPDGNAPRDTTTTRMAVSEKLPHSHPRSQAAQPLPRRWSPMALRQCGSDDDDNADGADPTDVAEGVCSCVCCDDKACVGGSRAGGGFAASRRASGGPVPRDASDDEAEEVERAAYGHMALCGTRVPSLVPAVETGAAGTGNSHFSLRSIALRSPAQALVPQGPQARYGHALCELCDDVYLLFGGALCNREYCNDVWLLTLQEVPSQPGEAGLWGSGGAAAPRRTRELWRKLELHGDQPTSRFGHSMHVSAPAGDAPVRLIVFGGSNNTEWYNDLFEVTLLMRRSPEDGGGGADDQVAALGRATMNDVGSDAGRVVAAAFRRVGAVTAREAGDPVASPLARRSHSLTPISPSLSILFGGHACCSMSDVWLLDEQAMRWTRMATAGADPARPYARTPSPRYCHAAVVVPAAAQRPSGPSAVGRAGDDDAASLRRQCRGKALYVFGGFSPEGTADATLWRLDLTDFVWTAVAVVGEVPPPRFGHTMSLMGNRLILFGGMSDYPHGATLNDCHQLSLDLHEWRLIDGNGRRTGGGSDRLEPPWPRADPDGAAAAVAEVVPSPALDPDPGSRGRFLFSLYGPENAPPHPAAETPGMSPSPRVAAAPAEVPPLRLPLAAAPDRAAPRETAGAVTATPTTRPSATSTSTSLSARGTGALPPAATARPPVRFHTYSVGGTIVNVPIVTTGRSPITTTATTTTSTNSCSDTSSTSMAAAEAEEAHPARPSARRSHTTVLSSSSNRLLIFGGWDGTQGDASCYQMTVEKPTLHDLVRSFFKRVIKPGGASASATDRRRESESTTSSPRHSDVHGYGLH